MLVTADEIAGQSESGVTDQAMLQSLLAAGSEYIYFKDAALRYIRVSQAYAAEFLALDDPQAAVGQSDFDFFPPDQAQQYAALERWVLESGMALMGREMQFVTKAGIHKQLLAYKYLVRDQAGAALALVGIFKDIDGRRASAEISLSEVLEVDSRRLIDQIRRSSDIEQVLQRTATGLAEMLDLSQVSIELSVVAPDQLEE
ncbi:MAG: PAS domain-containing protein [Chloroflexota bacterium]|nr:PAS domain-containing protein [Chloroflexota bacterium]